jgi:hypothetical protein
MNMAATAKTVPTLRQDAEAAAAVLEAGEAEADVVIERFLETIMKSPGLPRPTTDAIFWAKIPQHSRLLALRKILESPYA